jgi:phage baseplate assembly protein W
VEKNITYHIKKLGLVLKVVKCILSTEKGKAHMRRKFKSCSVNALVSMGGGGSSIQPPRVKAHTTLG